MVLNKSKWDHKAKVQYLRKHNLTQPKKREEPRRKWSSKRQATPEENLWMVQMRNGAEDDEWTDTDDVILNHFYPNISEDDISEDEKRRLKRSILATIRKQMEPPASSEPEPEGIYLGTRPSVQDAPASDPESDLDIADLDAKLDEFVVADFSSQKPRALLRHDLDGNLLEEYGMPDYRATVKDHDYNAAAATNLDLDHFSAEDLHGFKIGQGLDTLKSKSAPIPARSLTVAEKDEHDQRSKKAQDARFYDHIKRKFGTTEKPAKLLEINNFNPEDARSMSVLNGKLSQSSQGDQISSHDLDDLLGYTEKNAPTEAPFDLLAQLDKIEAPCKKHTESVTPETPNRANDTLKTKPAEQNLTAAQEDQQFLDDLLGA